MNSKNNFDSDLLKLSDSELREYHEDYMGGPIGFDEFKNSLIKRVESKREEDAAAVRIKKIDKNIEYRRRMSRYSEENAYANKKYLNVPYSEKDNAKKLGARWDADAKKWFWDNNAGNMPDGLAAFA